MRRALAVAALAAAAAVAALAPIAPDGDRYGAGGGAVCGTDAQCAAYSIEVLHVAPDGYGAANEES